ncbi:hypothetical protein PG996_013624 [Apiospora saccharicola]|uniref:Uncharacterized protein n=1 Tax=Apiospora saccharicola TaxID=335842 RepID=A0ABR1U617_9PEZI
MLDERSQWLKFNIFTYWKAASNQMAILTFDAQPPLTGKIVRFQNTSVVRAQSYQIDEKAKLEPLSAPL